MANHRVAGNGFGDQHCPRAIRRLQQPLYPAMLVAQHDLQLQDPLAVRLQAKVSRFDDPGVHRTHRDLVNLAPSDPLEGIVLTVR